MPPSYQWEYNGQPIFENFASEFYDPPNQELAGAAGVRSSGR